MNKINKISKMLIKNMDSLKRKKIIIFPFGEVGFLVNQLLKNKFDIFADCIIDNELCNYNNNIFSINILEKLNLDEYFFIFSTEKSELLDLLLEYNVSFNNILIIYEENILSYLAIKKICSEIEFNTVLDVGCGKGMHSKMFLDIGKDVTAITLENDREYDGRFIKNKDSLIVGDFLDISINKQYDVVWVSHILEHIDNINLFLLKLKNNIKPNGTLAITVPSRETNITLTHVHSFNAGRLLRYLLFSGFDVRNAQILEYGFNLSIILKNIKYIDEKINKDELFDYLPKEIPMKISWDNMPYFDGNITELNWF